MGARGGAVFVGHDIYRQAAYGSLHPLAIPRVESVVDLCRALQWFGPGEYEASPCATDNELAAFHDRDYIDALRRASARGQVDAAFALLTLLDAGLERVAYVDLDAHHCDAVQDAFAGDGRVRLVSIHESGRWPHTGATDDTAGGNALNLPVPRGFDDLALARLMDDVVLPHVAGYRPEAVVLTCGADALAGDPLAHLAFTNGALWDAVDALVAAAPVAVVLGGGGYNPWTLARYWTGLWGRLSGREIPAELPEAARAVLSRLSCGLIDDEDVQPEWLETLADRQRARA